MQYIALTLALMLAVPIALTLSMETIMKHLTLVVIVLGTLSTLAHADDTLYIYQGKDIGKTEAVKLLLKDPKADVIKGQHVELTDKLTFRKR